MVLKDFITENDTNHLNSEPAEKDIQPNAPTDKDCHKKSDEIHEGEYKNAVMQEDSAVEIEHSTIVYNTSNVHTSPERENCPVTSDDTGERLILLLTSFDLFFWKL